MLTCTSTYKITDNINTKCPPVYKSGPKPYRTVKTILRDMKP